MLLLTILITCRFDGLNEMPANAPNLNVKGKERLLVKAIPEHRIELIKCVIKTSHIQTY